MSEFGIIPERWSLAAIQFVNRIALGAMAQATLAPNLNRPPKPQIKVAFDPGAKLDARAAVDRDPNHVPVAYV